MDESLSTKMAIEFKNNKDYYDDITSVKTYKNFRKGVKFALLFLKGKQQYEIDNVNNNILQEKELDIMKSIRKDYKKRFSLNSETQDRIKNFYYHYFDCYIKIILQSNEIKKMI